ncbi:hypothetical protein HDU91_004395, partial [Kappamyces sp. JEL0680]
NGWAAPRLKDAVIEDEQTYRNIYRQLVKILWTLYNKCKLSVEHDHPHALEFLRKDVLNVLEFFRKQLPEQLMTVRELFEFVVSDFDTIRQKLDRPDLHQEQEILDAYLDQRPKDYLNDAKVKSNDEVFKNVYIPRTLDEVDDHELDVAKVLKGESPDLVYQVVTGLDVDKLSKPVSAALVEEEIDVSFSGSDSSSSDSEAGQSGDDDFKEKKSTLKKHEDPEAKKERKRLAKDEKKEKRKTKIPKALKKQKTKAKKK